MPPRLLIAGPSDSSSPTGLLFPNEIKQPAPLHFQAVSTAASLPLLLPGRPGRDLKTKGVDTPFHFPLLPSASTSFHLIVASFVVSCSTLCLPVGSSRLQRAKKERKKQLPTREVLRLSLLLSLPSAFRPNVGRLTTRVTRPQPLDPGPGKGPIPCRPAKASTTHPFFGLSLPKRSRGLQYYYIA